MGFVVLKNNKVSDLNPNFAKKPSFILASVVSKLECKIDIY